MQADEAGSAQLGQASFYRPLCRWNWIPAFAGMSAGWGQKFEPVLRIRYPRSAIRCSADFKIFEDFFEALRKAADL